MNNQIKLNDYKQQIADTYSRRSHNYDQSEYHSRITHRLVEYAQINPGYHVLDIATGTAHVAIEAAQIVGSSGRVVGVDISPEMLEQAWRKVEALNLSNVELILADAEALNFPANSFDIILCANAFPWMVDRLAALRQWLGFLKPDGLIGIHTPADTAFVVYDILAQVFEKYGVLLMSGKSIGTVEKFYNILERAGFEAIEIQTEQYGSYISLEQAQQTWTASSYPLPWTIISSAIATFISATKTN